MVPFKGTLALKQYFPKSQINRDIKYFYLGIIRKWYMTLSLTLLSLFRVRFSRPGEGEKTLSVQRPQPHTTNPWKEEKDKTVGDKKERADHANRKALALLLKPASPTPSNTGSLRSFQRDTQRDTKFLRY